VRRIAIALVLALGVPASAQARVHTIAPPGNAGVGQYLETVPTAGGGQPSNTVHPVTGAVIGSGGPGNPSGGARTAGGDAVSRSTERALAKRGPAGAAAASLAQATAPRRSSSSTPNTGIPASASTAAGSSPASSVFKSLTGSTGGGGLGPLLPSLLIASVLGAGVLALLRRRRTS
jgi:hypothetical protein